MGFEARYPSGRHNIPSQLELELNKPRVLPSRHANQELASTSGTGLLL